MLRSAVLAPARRCAANANQGLRAPVRRKLHSSAPARAGGDGIAHEVHYEGLWGAITTFPKRKPFATNCIVATVKTAIADCIVQQGEGKNTMETYDFKRTGVFTAFGFFYLGIVQWFVYVTMFTRLCPNAVRFSNLPWAEKLKDKAGQRDLYKQVLLDNFGHYTFIYFPAFYCFKESIKGDGLNMQMVNNAMGKYWNNIVQDNMAIWALWIPMDLIIYAVPVWMRLPLNHAVSFGWTMILSWMRGA